MTVRINKPALNLREELTKAQGVVRYEQRQFWMDGLVENGTFDADVSGWTTSNSVLSSVNSALRITQQGAGLGLAQATVQTTVGKTYKFVWDYIAGTAPTPTVRVGTSSFSNNLSDVTATTETATFVATTTTTYINFRMATTSDGLYSNFDNVKVFEADTNGDVIHSLPLGFKPLHVYEDGLLQREGDAHDYTVVKTGGAYAIKPTVQPTATTETCIIAEREL